MPFKEKVNQIRNRRWHRISRILKSRYVRIFLASVIAIGLATVVLQSYPNMEKYSILFYAVSVFSALFFTIEYFLRVLSAPVEYPELPAWKARRKYIFSFMGVIDLIAILPFTAPYFFQAKVVRDMIELGRIFLIFKILRYTKSFAMIREALSTVKYELLTALSFAMMIMSFCATLMYYIERQAQPDVFTDIGEGFWWAIITFTTVGYGDIYPITPLGKLLAGCMALVGIATLTLPTAIISGAMMDRLRIQREQREQNQKTIE